MRRLLRSVGIALVFMLLFAHAAFAADQPVAGTAELVGQSPLPPWGVLPTLQEGGFSGLYPVALPGQFWTLSDRGPNGDPFTVGTDPWRPFFSPAFTPTIYRVKVDPNAGEMTILQRIPLKLRPGFTDPARQAVGGPANQITGFGNTPVNAAANIPVTDEVPATDTDDDGDVDASDTPLPFDPYGVDTEGIVFDSRTFTFWLVEEYRPSILQVALDGTILQRIMPAGQNLDNLGAAWAGVPLKDILPAEYSSRRDNRGFEGVAISQDGRSLYAIMQNPLATSCSGTDPISGTPFVSTNNRSATRIAKVDITNPFRPKLAADVLYPLDTNPATGNVANGQLRISDLFWLAPDHLLVDERDDTAGTAAQGGTSTTTKHFYDVDLSAATNLMDLPPETKSCIDALTPAGVSNPVGQGGRGVTQGAKTLLLTPSATSGSAEYPVGKLEGMVRLPNGNFATVDDNDFRVGASANVPTIYIEYGPAKPVDPCPGPIGRFFCKLAR